MSNDYFQSELPLESPVDVDVTALRWWERLFAWIESIESWAFNKRRETCSE